MKIEDAEKIIYGFESANAQNCLSDNHIMKLGSVIREFNLDRQYRTIATHFRALERHPKDRAIADLLARQIKELFDFYRRKDDPYIVRPSTGDFNGPIVIARCGSTNYTMSFEEGCLHLFVCGRTGSGKTVLMRTLFKSLNKFGIRCIWVDTRKKSGRSLIKEFPNTLVVQFRYDSQTKFNILKEAPGVEIQKWRSQLGETLSTSMETYLGTRTYFWRHLTKTMGMNHPYYELLYESVLNDKISYYKNPRQISQKDGAIGRLTAIRNEIGPILNCIESYPYTKILQDGCNIVVEAADISPDVKIFCVESFLAWMLGWLEIQPNPEHTLKWYVLFDEGNDVFGINIKGKNEVLLNFMRTIRSAGCGICIGCQNVMIEPEVLNNVYAKAMLSMSDGVSIQKMVQSMMFPSKEHVEAIFRLQPLEGIVRTPAFPELFRITVEPYFLPDVSDAEVIANNERILSKYSYVPLPSDVIVIDEVSKPDEKKDEEEKNTKTELTDDERKVLSDIYTRPYESVSKRLMSLGFSGSVGNKLKKSLIDKGYVVEYSLKLGQGRGKLGKILILLDKAELVIESAKG